MAAASAGVVVGEMAALEDLQKEVHVAIRERGFSRASRERCIERVKRCLDAVPAHVERIWPDHDTQSRPSAMCQAIRQKAFDVYCLLLSRGCQFKNARERMKCFDDVGPIQKSELQYQLTRFARRNQDAHVDYLKSRSFSVPPHDGFTEEVDSLYRELDGDALIRTVLQVAATSGYLRIFFDFAREDVQCMAALRNEQTYGLTDPERHTIYIAANRNRGDVLGTLAHELCHLAVSLAYENGGKPYRSDDRQGREHYQSVLEETMGRNPEEIILRDAFESEKSEEELIVRVPHVLAKYGHGGVNRLNENAPSLFQHFKSVFIPDMENYLIRFRGEIDDKKTSHTNAKLGKACKTDDLGVTFTEVPSQEELVDVPLLVLTAPNLTLLEVMVHDLLKATKLSYLFLEAQKWNDAVETLLSKDKCDVVLLSNPSNAVPEDSCDRMADILSELSETRGTRVIHLTTNEQMDLVAKTLRRQSFLSINTVSHEQRKACFLNVAEDCKRNVLRRSWINFQGSRERLSKWEETDLNSLLSAMDEDTFMALCQSNELNVGPQLRRDTEGYYVTRTCQRWSSYKETHLMETNEKIIAVTGAPGMGKTRLASRIAKMIKESGNREWVLHVDLPKVSKKLKALNAEDACGDLENFAEVCGVKKAGFEFALFKKTIREGSPFKVVLILDAVDEMCEDDRKKLLRFLHLLVLVRKEVSKVFVFSRSVFKDELREALSSEPYELLPFTVQEQETFLKQYKERTTQGPVTHQEPSAVHRLQDVWRLLKDDETLLGIPFFLRMVAALDHGEVFDDIDSDVLRKVFESTGSERYLSIYELATEYRYLQHRKEKKKEDISRACVEDDDVILKGHFYSSHRALAMKAVFDKKLCEDLLHEDEKESMSLLNKVSKNLLKHGLLDGLRDDRPVFSPQSIAEFWAAERLFGKISSSGSDTLHRFVFSMYGQGSCKRVTGFFDSFGMKSNEFHFAVMNRNVSYLRNCARDQDRDKLERNQWHIAALHADEDTISVLSSTETRSLEEKDKLGVTPYDYVLQLHEWTRLHSICSQCSNGGVCIAPVNNSSPHFVERELKDLQQWLLREQRVYCPSRSSGKALFFHVESPVALKRLTSSCCHYCWQTERISRVLDETRHRVPYENDNHAVWTAVTKHVPHSIVDNTDRAACAHPGAKCQCWAVLMFVLPDPNRSGLYEVQRGLQFIHMWFGLSTGCRKSEKTASAQRSDTSPTDDEESSDKWIDNRTNIHKAIDERNVDGVKKCLQFAPHLKLWLHPSSDETALHRAVKKQRMSIYRLLREHGCIMRDEETADCCHETANVEAFTHRFYDDNTLQTLRSHTESRPETADNERRTDDFYHALQANDLLRPMLSVSGTSQRVNVILNYDMESIDTVEGALENPNHGFANLETETICVAAKRDKGEVLGTLSHEFGHLALQFVYRNGGKPYLLTDRERELLYDTILYNIRKNQDKMDSLLKDLPREHDKEELIAYVPHLLAQYGSPGGENILEKEAPELFDFFKNVVIPDMIAYTKNRFPTRDQARIEVENRRLRHADQTEDRQVKLKRDLDYRDLPDAPILILTAPHLTVLEIMAYNAVKSTEQTHLFFMSSQWNPRLQDVLLSNCCKCVLITCDQDADIQNMLELLIELNEVAGTKVILLAQEDNVKNMVRRLEGHPFLANVHKVMNVSCAHLDTVKEDTKREILRTSRICFQGSPRLLSLEDLLDLDDDVQIPDEVTSLLSCQAKTIDIGMPVPRLDQRECYVERKCHRCNAVDIKNLPSSSDEAFAFCGDKISKIRRVLPPGQHIYYFHFVQKFDRYVYLDSIDEYRVLVNTKFYKEKVVHLLQYDASSQSFLLIKSNGPTSHLPVTGKHTCSEVDLVNKEGVVVVCGLPGMGKTSLALRLCNMTKEKNEKNWVLYVDLSKMNRSLRSLEIGDAPGLLMRFAALCGVKEKGLEFMLFQRSIKTGSPFKVTAFFDAFDEVEESSRKNVLLVTKLLTSTKACTVFIFSRNVFKTVLQDTLQVVPFELCPLEDKMALETARDEVCLKRQMVQVALLAMGRELSRNPLLLRMTMGLIEDKIPDDFLISLEIRTGCNENIATLFRKLVEYKCMIYKKEKRSDDVLLPAVQDDYDVLGKQFYHDHELLAAMATLGDELSKQVLTDEEREELETRVMKLVPENRLRQGFIDGEINGHAVFVSETFEAYFTARLLSCKVSTKRSPNTTRIVRDMYSGATYGRCIVHLGCLEEAISMSVAALKDFRATCPTPSSTSTFVEQQTSIDVASKKVSQGMEEQRNYEQYLDILRYLEKAIYKHLEPFMLITPTTCSKSRTRFSVRIVGTDNVESESLTEVESDQCSYQQTKTQEDLPVCRLEDAMLDSFEILGDLIAKHSKYDEEQNVLDLKFWESILEAFKLGDNIGVLSKFRTFVHSAATILGRLRDTYSKLSSTGDEADVERKRIVDKSSQVLTFFDSSGAACCSIHTAIINGDSVDINEESMNMLDEHGRTPLHVAALYASPETLKNLPLTDKLPRKDLLGMTPLMYADITCAWRRLDILCERHKDDSIKWDDQISTVRRNIRTENRLDRSVLCECIEMELHHLLSIILSQFCSLVYHGEERNKTPERVRVDSKRGDRGETPLFRAKSSNVFLLLLPYSNLEAVESGKRTLLHQCAMKGRVDIAKRVLIRFATSGGETWLDTPLGLAVRYWQHNVVNLLIPHFPADVEAICMRLHVWIDSATRLYERHLSILKLLHPHSSGLFQQGVPNTITMCNDCDSILYLLPYLNVHATVFDRYDHYELFEHSESYYRKRRGMGTLRIIKVIKLFLLHSLVSDWAMFMAGADDENLCDIIKPVLPHCDVSEICNLVQFLEPRKGREYVLQVLRRMKHKVSRCDVV